VLPALTGAKRGLQTFDMHESKNKKRFILLTALTVVTLLAFWWLQPENRLEVEEDIFHVQDLSAISRVELVADTSRISLAFNGARWRINQKSDADGNMIRVLFATLQQAKAKRPVANERKDSIYNHLADTGVKVSLYEGEALRMEFLAGGNSAKTQAFFGDPESKEVYVMMIPGYRVYVSGIFEVPENAWKDKLVFGFNWRNFRSLEASFPWDRSENFRVSMTRDHFGIEGLAEADTAKLNTFLDDVSLLTADEYITEPGLIDSLLRITPVLHLKIADVGNRTYELRLFDSSESGSFPGIIGNDQVAIFEGKKIQALLKPKSFFKKK
jgi:hypothetical protein